MELHLTFASPSLHQPFVLNLHHFPHGLLHPVCDLPVACSAAVPGLRRSQVVVRQALSDSQYYPSDQAVVPIMFSTSLELELELELVHLPVHTPAMAHPELLC